VAKLSNVEMQQKKQIQKAKKEDKLKEASTNLK
jgi:hypothetical protein